MIAPAAMQPEVHSFTAPVTEVQGRHVSLDESYFYPAGGGQPADRGRIDDIPVVDVTVEDAMIVHELADAPPFEAGDVVAGEVDTDFRRFTARAHTASHVVYGAARRHCEGLGYAGFDISDERVRIDLETPTRLDSERLAAIATACNTVVWEDRAVTWEQVPAATAREDAAVAFNVKTEEGVFDAGGPVRIVRIADWDAAACGGTHVRSTAAIGPIMLQAVSNPGAGITRIEFTVGPPAIAQLVDGWVMRRRLSQVLDAPTDALVEAAETLRAAHDEHSAAHAELAAQTARLQLQALPRSDATGWAVGVVEGVPTEGIETALREDALEDVVVVIPGARIRLMAAAGADHDAAALIDEVTGSLGGGGGGSPAFAQAGGIDAAVETVLEAVETATGAMGDGS
jgi:alanyl-tRNA synthetase